MTLLTLLGPSSRASSASSAEALAPVSGIPRKGGPGQLRHARSVGGGIEGRDREDSRLRQAGSGGEEGERGRDYGPTLTASSVIMAQSASKTISSTSLTSYESEIISSSEMMSYPGRLRGWRVLARSTGLGRIGACVSGSWEGCLAHTL